MRTDEPPRGLGSSPAIRRPLHQHQKLAGRKPPIEWLSKQPTWYVAAVCGAQVRRSDIITFPWEVPLHGSRLSCINFTLHCIHANVVQRMGTWAECTPGGLHPQIILHESWNISVDELANEGLGPGGQGFNMLVHPRRGMKVPAGPSARLLRMKTFRFEQLNHLRRGGRVTGGPEARRPGRLLAPGVHGRPGCGRSKAHRTPSPALPASQRHRAHATRLSLLHSRI